MRRDYDFGLLTTVLLGALLALGLAACGDSGGDDEGGGEDAAEVQAIEQALEMEDGGLNTEDDAPVFGDEATFEELGELAEDEVVQDEVAEDAEVVAAEEHPHAKAFAVSLAWGQLRLNPDVAAATVWEGTVTVNRGALVVRRRILFEEGDSFTRPDRRTVAFESTTRPHRDGLLLHWVLSPEMDVDVEGVPAMTFTSGDYSATVTVGQMIRHLRVDEVGDAAGNRVAVHAFELRPGLCAQGFLTGRWISAPGRDDLGRWIGRWVQADGSLAGHLRGVWGRRQDGERVLFARYIDRTGTFRGLIRGRYADGAFAGVYVDPEHKVLGRLGGHYVLATEGERRGGFFRGRWGRACPDDPEAVQEALEEGEEGLDMEDGEDHFADDAFAELDELDEDPAVDDGIEEQDDAVRQARERVDGPALAVDVAWGYLRLRPEGRPRVWGSQDQPATITVSRGALVVLRRRKFEERTDGLLLPRNERRTVALRSVTGPHWDGLKLLWLLDRQLDPNLEADAPATMTFTSGDVEHTVTLAAPPEPVLPLQVTELDDAGHSLLVSGYLVRPLPDDACRLGVLGGRWIQLPRASQAAGAPAGLFYGRWMGALGGVEGHLRGVWGVRDGAPLLAAKILGVDGRFIGLMVGTYAADTFTAQWRTRAGEAGSIRGRYWEPADTDLRGGLFHGGYASSECLAE